jgi:four helix bundle protein
MFNFERLDAWQAAVEFADAAYAVTRTFPADERFGLTSQIRRASVSVSANLAEGSSRSSKREFKRFIEIAYASLMEVVSHLFIAKRLTFINEPDFQRLYQAAEKLTRILSGLRRGLGEDSPPL